MAAWGQFAVEINWQTCFKLGARYINIDTPPLIQEHLHLVAICLASAYHRQESEGPHTNQVSCLGILPNCIGSGEASITWLCCSHLMPSQFEGTLYRSKKAVDDKVNLQRHSSSCSEAIVTKKIPSLIYSGNWEEPIPGSLISKAFEIKGGCYNALFSCRPGVSILIARSSNLQNKQMFILGWMASKMKVLCLICAMYKITWLCDGQIQYNYKLWVKREQLIELLQTCKMAKTAISSAISFYREVSWEIIAFRSLTCLMMAPLLSVMKDPP